MSANYEWQKRQVRDRIAGRLQESERHRLATAARAGRPGFVQRLFVLLKALWPVLMRLWHRTEADAAKSGETVVREQLVS